MISEYDIKDLIQYKKRLSGFLFLFTILFFSFFLEMKMLGYRSYYVNVLLFAQIAFFLTAVLFEINSIRAIYLYISNTLMMLVIAVFFLPASILFQHRFIFKWNLPMVSLLIGVLLLMFITAVIIEYRIWHKVILERNDILDTSQGIFDFFGERTKKIKHHETIYILLFGTIVLLIAYLLQHFNICVNSGKIIVKIALFAFMGFFFGFACVAFFAQYCTRTFLIHRWERATGKKLYTRLKVYIDREDEINRWRSERGLKPIKIQSPFFFGDVEKY